MYGIGIDINVLMAIVGLCLTIFFGVYAVEAHKKAAAVMEEYRGFFHTYAAAIIEVTRGIENATKYIKILLDSTGFGDVTEKTRFLKYHASLLDAADRRVEIELIYLKDEKLKEMVYRQQFPNGSEGYYEELLKKANGYAKELKELKANELRKNVEIYRTDSIPFLIFIFDGIKGIMAVQNYEGGRVIPLGFVTKDSRSLEFLEDIFERIKKNSSPEELE